MDNELFAGLVTSLNEAVAITKGDMPASREFSYEKPDVKAVREKTGLSQVEFASKLNISPRTLQNWEQGHRNPTGAAVTLMRLLDKQPELLAFS